MIGYRRRRRRFLLLAMAVLPQLASLAAMAGMFWAVKIKDVISASAAFARESNGAVVSFNISAADRPKLQVGSAVHGAVLDVTGARGQEFSANVTQISDTSPTSKRLPYKVEARLITGVGEHASVLTGAAHPVTVTMWMRTRRALDVVLSRASVSGVASNALSNKAFSGIPQ